MKLEREDTLRVAYMVMAGLMFTGAFTAWNTAGYLNIYAWVIEWAEIFLAFYFIVAATLDSKSIQARGAKIMMVVSVAIFLLSISFTLINPNSMSADAPFTPNPLFYSIFAVPVIAAIAVYITPEKGHNIRNISLAFFLAFAASMMLLTYVFYLTGPRLPTDEATLSLYAGHIFLEGMNPYNPSSTLEAFSYYHFAYYFETPLTTGGYVSTLTYPALSFLIVLPAIIFNLKPTVVMLPFFLIPIILVWYRAWSLKEWMLSIFIMIVFLSFPLYTSQIELGDFDIVWVSLLMASYFFLTRTKLSGAFFGASLSVKQFPAIVLPFLLYYIFRTYGLKKTLTWVITAAAAFLAINGYFMLTNLHFFVHNLLQDELSPLLGVGLGISQISFLGFIDIPRVYFTISLIVVFLALLASYILFYDKLKYAFFAFPILIFFFNYRLFIQYLVYWLIISLLPAIDLIFYRRNHVKDQGTSKSRTIQISRNHRNLRILAVFIIVVMAMGVAVGYHEGVSQNSGHFTINSVEFVKYNSTGFVEEAVVNLTFSGNNVNQTPVLFRFIIPGGIIYVNTCLWEPENGTTLQSGHPASVAIVPLHPLYSFQRSSPYRLVAYYNTIQGAYSHDLSI